MIVPSKHRHKNDMWVAIDGVATPKEAPFRVEVI